MTRVPVGGITVEFEEAGVFGVAAVRRSIFLVSSLKASMSSLDVLVLKAVEPLSAKDKSRTGGA